MPPRDELMPGRVSDPHEYHAVGSRNADRRRAAVFRGRAELHLQPIDRATPLVGLEQ